jgi:hypothetical protein
MQQTAHIPQYAAGQVLSQMPESEQDRTPNEEEERSVLSGLRSIHQGRMEQQLVG